MLTLGSRVLAKPWLRKRLLRLGRKEELGLAGTLAFYPGELVVSRLSLWWIERIGLQRPRNGPCQWRPN